MRPLPRAAGRYAVEVSRGCTVVAAITAAGFFAHVNYLVPSLLYLLVVVFQSMSSGYTSAATVSVVAAVCLDYFFIPPVLEWDINDPEDALALFTYLVTSLVITRLATSTRAHAQISETKRKEVAPSLRNCVPVTSVGIGQRRGRGTWYIS